MPGRCFGAVSEAGSEARSWRPRDATLANVLRPSAKIATSKPHGGGDGPRLAWVVDRRPLQLRVALVIGVDSCLLGASRSRGNTPTAAYCSAEPDESNKLAFWACWARRASGVLVPLPWPKNKLPSIPTSGASFPQATETKNPPNSSTRSSGPDKESRLFGRGTTWPRPYPFGEC